ncbi:MAG TPA: response regulator [Candidatus Altiarchaeales archaeon]|nr:response regulator [Candidatus Altiarchaeales archaeon]
MVKILVIDDSVFERRVIVSLLKKNGYNNIAEADNGVDGIRKYCIEEPDLVILDLKIPNMDGLDTIERLKEIDSNARIIAASIIRNRATIEDCIRRGAEAYIEKPITEAKLIPQVKELICDKD